jgi:hypothetical protein
MIKAALGWLIIVIGILIFIVPALGWPGVLIAAGGGILVLRHSRWSRRNFVNLAKKYPATVGRARRWIAGKVANRADKSSQSSSQTSME